MDPHSRISSTAETGEEPAGERRLRSLRLIRGQALTGLRRPVGDVLGDNYVLFEGDVNADRSGMAHTSSDRQRDVTELAGDIVRELEERGLPSGAWLFDIARVRQSLREADTLLRRLEDAIIRSQSTASLDEL